MMPVHHVLKPIPCSFHRVKESRVLTEVVELEFDLLAKKFLSIASVTSSAFNTKGISFKEIASALIELVDLKGIHLTEVAFRRCLSSSRRGGCRSSWHHSDAVCA